MTKMNYGQHWADVIAASTTDAEATAVVNAINKVTASGQANPASVMMACVQILSQSITRADPLIAREVRAGILAMIDNFAMEFAVQEPPDDDDRPMRVGGGIS